MNDTVPEGADFEELEANPNAGKEHDGVVAVGDDELSKLAVAKALGFEKLQDLNKYSDQVQRLVDYANMKGAKDITGIISELNGLRNELGMSKNIYNLSVYAGMALQENEIRQKMNAFKNGTIE